MIWTNERRVSRVIWTNESRVSRVIWTNESGPLCLVVAGRPTDPHTDRVPGVRLPGGVGEGSLPVFCLRYPEDFALLPPARHVGMDSLHLLGAVCIFPPLNRAGHRYKASQEGEALVEMENNLERKAASVGGEVVSFKSGAEGQLLIVVEGGIKNLRLASPVGQLCTGVS